MYLDLGTPFQQGVFINIPRSTGLLAETLLFRTELLTSKSQVVPPSVKYLLLTGALQGRSHKVTDESPGRGNY